MIGPRNSNSNKLRIVDFSNRCLFKVIKELFHNSKEMIIKIEGTITITKIDQIMVHKNGKIMETGWNQMIISEDRIQTIESLIGHNLEEEGQTMEIGKIGVVASKSRVSETKIMRGMQINKMIKGRISMEESKLTTIIKHHLPPKKMNPNPI